MVIGPSDDGGYYLIGANDFHPSLFPEIEWGSSEVLNQTTDSLKDAGVSFSLIDQLSDIDTADDYEAWLAYKANKTK